MNPAPVHLDFVESLFNTTIKKYKELNVFFPLYFPNISIESNDSILDNENIDDDVITKPTSGLQSGTF